MTRTRYVDDRTELVDVSAEYAEQDYHQVHAGKASATFERKDHGSVVMHLLVFVVAGWWTLGLANLGYAMYRRHVSADRVEVCVQ